MLNITVKKTTTQDGKERWYVKFPDGKEAVCFKAECEQLAGLDALPEGWTLDPPKQEGWAPMLKAPNKGFAGKGGGGGGFASWRNTEAGEKFTNEQMNRRTALMQAVEVMGFATADGLKEPKSVVNRATEFYDWLMATTGSHSPAQPEPQKSTPVPPKSQGKAEKPVETASSIPAEKKDRTPEQEAIIAAIGEFRKTLKAKGYADMSPKAVLEFARDTPEVAKADVKLVTARDIQKAGEFLPDKRGPGSVTDPNAALPLPGEEEDPFLDETS